MRGFSFVQKNWPVLASLFVLFLFLFDLKTGQLGSG
jgi:hypothetical protein